MSAPDPSQALPRRSRRRELLDAATGWLEARKLLSPMLVPERPEGSVGDWAERNALHENALRFAEAINLPPTMPWRSRKRFAALIGEAWARYEALVEWEQRDWSPGNPGASPPIIIASLPRSGSTLLQDLLLQDPGSRGLMPWELITPFPSPQVWGTERDRRVRRFENQARAAARKSPVLERMHRHLGASECWPLLFTGFLSHTPFMFFNLGDKYIHWRELLSGRDRNLAYDLYRRQLGMFQALNPGRYWVLKSPEHLLNLDVVAQVFPQATIVVLRRDPAQVVPSCCDLAWHLQFPHRPGIDARQLGREVLDVCAWSLERYRDLRRAGIENNPNVIEIDYRQLVERPMECVRKIHAGRGKELGEAAIEGMERWLQDRHWGARSSVRHDRDVFGLGAEQLAALDDVQ